MLRAKWVLSELKSHKSWPQNVNETTAAIAGCSVNTFQRVCRKWKDSTVYDGNFFHGGGKVKGSRKLEFLTTPEFNVFIRTTVDEANKPKHKKNGKGINFRQLHKKVAKKFDMHLCHSDGTPTDEVLPYRTFMDHCRSMGLRKCVVESKHTLKFEKCTQSKLAYFVSHHHKMIVAAPAPAIEIRVDLRPPRLRIHVIR